MRHKLSLSRVCSVVVLLALVSLPAFAIGGLSDQPPPQKLPTREQLERQDTLDGLRSALDEASQALETMTRQRGSACLKAFGHDAFCRCLNEHLAVGVSFGMYITAVTSTNEELAYTRLSQGNRKLVDNARQIREACVSSVWAH